MWRNRIAENSTVSIGTHQLQLWQDALVAQTAPADLTVPIVYAGNASKQELDKLDIKGKAVAVQVSAEGINLNVSLPERRYPSYVMRKYGTDLLGRGAAAIIFIADQKGETSWGQVLPALTRGLYDIEDGPNAGTTAKPPVIWIHEMAADWVKENANLSIHLAVERFEYPSVNIIAKLEGTDAVLKNEYVLYSGHNDHDGIRQPYGNDSIYNGADDNASGTAALMELARIIKSEKIKKNNYLFIAFSGEEMGLFGSKYFTEHPTIDLATVNYMINMDMVGRLNDSTHVLTVGGYGTSPAWGEVITAKAESFTIHFDSSGTGPSDHTSFYRKDIPVLFFFTGLHSDYHKPTDDADKINYTGELQVVKYINTVITNLNPHTKLAFTKTREQQMGTSARFSVTMGIMPDYTFSGEGVRVDGVSDGRPAQKAGLKTGDVILKLGEYATGTLESYMQALGKFKKGDNTRVKVKRGNDEMEFTVVF